MLAARIFRFRTSRSRRTYSLGLRRGQTGGAGQGAEIKSKIAPRGTKAHTGVAASGGSRQLFDNPLGRSIAALVLLWLYFIDAAGRPSQMGRRLQGETK
jgi:hypothetical protein